MSEKHLTELAWKAFARGKGYKDAALVKAMAELEKARKGSPATLVDALDGIDKQAVALLKTVKGDKDLEAYIDEVCKQAQQQRKAAVALAVAAAKGDDEEEDSPALLTTALAPMLRLVKKGDPIHAMVIVAGSACAVMLSRKPIGAPRRKLLAEYLKNPSGAKYLVGQCTWEENACTFVLAASASGLAKKLQAALLAQSGTRIRVRVRGESPDDVDDAGEDAAVPEAPPKPQLKPSVAAPAVMARLAALQSRIKLALAGPSGDELKTLVARIGPLAQKGPEDAAKAALVRIEALLDAPPARVPSQATPGGAVNYAKCRLAWDATKKSVQADLQKLERIILAEYKDAPAFGELSKKIRKLDTVLQGFADDLADILDDALNASQPAERQKHHRAAAAVIAKFLAHANNDPFMAKLETNPFVPIHARQNLVKTLGELSRQITA